ncbi:hypothetical protein JCM16161A_15640 [Vulcanisaeta sp. JCM 16161]
MRLLREDEEFRLAVMGLLGITDIQSSIRQLINAVNELVKTVQRLAEDQEKLWQEVRALREDQNRLWQENKRINENIEKLWQENNRLWEEVKRLADNQERLWQENRSIRRELSGISRTVGALVERDVRHYLPNWVRERFGINVDRLRRARIEGVGEFDGYAEVDNKVIAAEIKATLRLRDVEDFVDKVSKLRSVKASREVIAVIAYVNETRDTGKAIELARANGIKVVKHHGEDDFEELT